MNNAARSTAAAAVFLVVLVSSMALLKPQPQTTPARRLTPNRTGATGWWKGVARAAQHASVNRATSPESETVAADEVHGFLASLDGETDPDTRCEMLEAQARSIPESQLPAVLQALSVLDDHHAKTLHDILVSRWAETNLEAAVAWATCRPGSDARNRALVQVAVTWAARDLVAANQWVLSLPEDGGKTAAITTLAYEAARTAPEVSLELARSLPSSVDRNQLLIHAASQWAAAAAPEAKAWVEALPETQLRQRLLEAVAVASAEADASAAASMVVAALTPGEEQDRAAVAIVQRWAQFSPGDAANWVAGFPQTLAGRAAARELVGSWAMQDPDAAADWATMLPEGVLREAALGALGEFGGN